MPLPIAVEFARCFDEHNLGVDFRVAVENLTKRVPNNLDLRIFAMSVVLQHETGGNLVEILEQIENSTPVTGSRGVRPEAGPARSSR